MLASALYQLIDGVFVGRILGETAFAALNLSMPFVIINFALADLIGVGSSVPISISLGQKRDAAANNIFSCACAMIVGAGVAVGALLYAAAPLLIALMGASGEFAELAVAYLRVYALCSPVTTIVFAMDNYLRICGKVRGSMLLNILMSVLSAALEFLFLFVLDLGIIGAALGTCSGMILCALIAFFAFTRGKMQLRFCRPRFRLSMVREIVACGTPNFLNNIAGRVTSIVMNMLLVRLGGESAVSIYGILMYVEGFIQPLLYGMCDSLQPAVGYNWGAGRLDRVKAIERCCFVSSAILSLLSVAVIALLPEPITVLFMGETEPYLPHRGGFRIEALQPHLHHTLVFVRRAELYAGRGKARKRFHHFRQHGAGVPALAAGRALSAGADGHLAEFCAHRRAGRDSGHHRDGALFPQAARGHIAARRARSRCERDGLSNQRAGRKSKSARPQIVDKPSVCQRICPTACKSDDLRPAVGTGMHFYRKRKRLLCKKCQK